MTHGLISSSIQHWQARQIWCDLCCDWLNGETQAQSCTAASVGLALLSYSVNTRAQKTLGGQPAPGIMHVMHMLVQALGPHTAHLAAPNGLMAPTTCLGQRRPELYNDRETTLCTAPCVGCLLTASGTASTTVQLHMGCHTVSMPHAPTQSSTAHTMYCHGACHCKKRSM